MQRRNGQGDSRSWRGRTRRSSLEINIRAVIAVLEELAVALLVVVRTRTLLRKMRSSWRVACRGPRGERLAPHMGLACHR